MILRKIASHVRKLSTLYPVVTITGPRQSGKTTLARACFPDLPYINLENLETRQYAKDDPVGFLKQNTAGAILDEIQNVPEITSYIQELVDEKKQNGRFVLTGSRQFNLYETVSQSLAGRTGIVKLLPFSLSEIEGQFPDLGDSTEDYLYRGFYPRLYDQHIEPAIGLTDYVETYVERDLRQLSQIQDLLLFRKFLKLCAGRIGQLLNFSNLAEDTGISHKTAAEWISLLEASFIVFRLPPFYTNINKRLIKSPKLYFYDTGLGANLLGIEERKQVETHPLRGALYENLVIMEVLKHRYNQGRKENLSFFRDAKGHEVDLMYHSANDNYLIEIKSAATVRTDFFKGMDYFSEFIGTTEKKILVYDGDRNEQRSRAIVTNIKNLTNWL